MTENWKPITRAPGYSISDFGRVRNDKNGRILKHSFSEGRYACATVHANGRPYRFGVARKVAAMFLPPPPHPSNRIQFINGDYSDVRAANLKWTPLAEVNANSPVRQKITPDEAEAIREQYARGGISQKALGEGFGLTQSTVWAIVNGITWREYLDAERPYQSEAA